MSLDRMDRLTAIATLAKLEADAAPEGSIRNTLNEAARYLIRASRMYEDVAAGACPGCGKPAGMATPGCDSPRGCGRRPTATEFAELLARPAVKVDTAEVSPAKKAAATRASRKAVA